MRSKRLCQTAGTLVALALVLNGGARFARADGQIFSPAPSVSSGNLVLHLDSRTGVTQTGGFVDAWADQSGLGNHFTSSGGNRPAYIGSQAINGLISEGSPVARPAVRFDGSNDVLRRLGSTFSPGSIGDGTVFIVTTPSSNTGTYRGFMSANAGGGNDYNSGFNFDQGPGASATFNYFGPEGARFPGSNIDVRGSSTPFNDYRVLTFSWDASTGSLFDGTTLDGSRPVLAPAGIVDLDEVRLGSRYYGGSEQGPFHGDILSVLMFDNDLSAGDRLAVQNFLIEQFFTNPAQLTPEPGSLALCGLAAVGFGFLYIRRRRHQA